MVTITDADRQAAQNLRIILADISGFWHQVGDDSPLCLALARHRREAERRLIEKIVPLPAPRVAERRTPRLLSGDLAPPVEASL